MNTPQLTNQSILSILSLLHFILTIQLTFLKIFYIFLIFYATPKFFLPQRRAQDGRKGSPAENDRRPARGLEALNHPEAARVGEHPQLLPPFLGSPGRKQSEPLPTVEAS